MLTLVGLFFDALSIGDDFSRDDDDDRRGRRGRRSRGKTLTYAMLVLFFVILLVAFKLV